VRDVFSIGKQEYITERGGFARFNVENIDIDGIALRDAKLPATGFDDCVSHRFLWGEKDAHNPTSMRGWQTQSASCAEMGTSS
jgi:hypothetical protein